MRPLAQLLALCLSLVVTTHKSYAQEVITLPAQKQEEVEQYKELVSRYKLAENPQQAAFYLNRIAFVYWENGNVREAISYFLETVPLNEKAGNFNDVKTVFSNIALIYADMDRLDLALEYFEKSLEARKKLNSKFEVTAGLIDIAYILTALNQTERAISTLNEAYALAQEINNPRLILNCLRLLAQSYDKQGNIARASEYMAKFDTYEKMLETQSIRAEADVKISQSQAETERERMQRAQQELLMSLRELQAKARQDSLTFIVMTKQDSLKKAEEEALNRQREIVILTQSREIQATKLREQEAQTRAQQLIIYSTLAFLAIVFGAAIITFKNYRDKQRANQLLNMQNIEIQRQSDLIHKQNENITKSINYAQGIQKALLPEQAKLQEIFAESFIFFKPRDIVSGDYYWFKELTLDRDEEVKNGKVAVAAIDCTGHGVPGAFLSMIGYNLLDEIVYDGIHEPGRILKALNNGIRRTLRQDETDNRDGMDMALCVVDTVKNVVEFSGAKNPLIYVANGEVTRIRGDKDSIGGGVGYMESDFTTHTIPIEHPTWFYMFSDGFIDQFGGDDGRKFMIKHFVDFLASIAILPANQQREMLKNTLRDWLGTKYTQIDDILVVGFQVHPNGQP